MTFCILFAAWARAGFAEILDFVKEKTFHLLCAGLLFVLVLGVFVSKILFA